MGGAEFIGCHGNSPGHASRTQGVRFGLDVFPAACLAGVNVLCFASAAVGAFLRLITFPR